jgi:hypothetical protein
MVRDFSQGSEFAVTRQTINNEDGVGISSHFYTVGPRKLDPLYNPRSCIIAPTPLPSFKATLLDQVKYSSAEAQDKIKKLRAQYPNVAGLLVPAEVRLPSPLEAFAIASALIYADNVKEWLSFWVDNHGLPSILTFRKSAPGAVSELDLEIMKVREKRAHLMLVF